MQRAPTLGLLLALAAAACDRPETTSPLGRAEAIARSPMNATLLVTSTADAGAGSLRDAIASAASGDVITFDASLAGQTITLTTGQLLIAGKSITIEGSSTSGITISGGNASRVIDVAGDAGLILRNATITGGRIAGSGAGIYAAGSLRIEHSTIVDNTALDSYIGGGVVASGPVSVVNSTISGNQAGSVSGAGGAGGIYVAGVGEATRELINVTIAGNSAGIGGGLMVSAPLTLHNTIIAANEALIDDNCFRDLFGPSGPLVITRLGVNVVSDDSCGGASANLLIVPDAMLGPLASNGGPTQTRALLLGSPAIDVGMDCTVTTDQRYVARPAGLSCDAGAYEFTAFVSVPVTVDPSGTVNNATGVALLSGTVTCPAVALPAPLAIHLAQRQKSGKVYFDVQATASVTVSCSGSAGPVPWSAFLAPPNAAFQNGMATVNATLTGLPGGYLATPVASQVKLFWSKG